MRTAIKLTLIGALLLLHLGVLYATLHPRVSPAYRAYFIDRTTPDWNLPHYPATLQDGMDFSRPGLPAWVDRISGFSYQEPAGRWTDENRGPATVVFANGLSGQLCVEFTATAVNQMKSSFAVKLGEEVKTVQELSPGDQKYQVQFDQVTNAGRLEFLLPPNLPTVHELDRRSDDLRRLGLLVRRLRIVPGQCSATP